MALLYYEMLTGRRLEFTAPYVHEPIANRKGQEQLLCKDDISFLSMVLDRYPFECATIAEMEDHALFAHLDLDLVRTQTARMPSTRPYSPSTRTPTRNPDDMPSTRRRSLSTRTPTLDSDDMPSTRRRSLSTRSPPDDADGTPGAGRRSLSTRTPAGDGNDILSTRRRSLSTRTHIRDPDEKSVASRRESERFREGIRKEIITAKDPVTSSPVRVVSRRPT
ncbi:hypothetical protein HYPSUDRAFT_200907 [Hypholoma sublateritium FD-334 SS-4]|uniref:Uncharacterized protein n=1 Tax=Hypholoma sublateritium (strain FD-334 SS-4) TaxID=945553 RepID=A0A0D2MK77_HYPSF|nr:hypothetical protein HYPSUDRAFT_200907 [Hypholoma sublateritium FD-334 SS-4]